MNKINNQINVTPYQVKLLLDVLGGIDIYVMSTNEYMELAKLIAQLEEIDV